MQDSYIRFSDAVLVIATIIGPILAVQAQKAVERLSEAKNRKEKIFYTLMSTRMSRLSSDHILALNSIPLVFGRKGILGFRRKSNSEKAVLEGWDTYQDILNTKVDGLSEAQFNIWVERCDNAFNDLLFTMSQALGFHFSKLQVAKGAYAPMAQAQLERKQQEIIDGLIDVLRGEKSLPMRVESINHDQNVLDLQQKISETVLTALKYEGIPVKLTRRARSEDETHGH